MTDPTDASEPAEEPLVARKAGRRWPWPIAVVVILIYAIPAVLTSDPRACATCHEMKPYYDSWRVSSHRGAAPNCLYCHVRPGVLNLVTYQVLFYREIVASMLGWHLKPIGAISPSNQSCQRSGCHSVNRQVSNSGNLNINHRLHVSQAGIPCTKCHSGAVHKGVGRRVTLPPMSVCRECHAAEMNGCSYCHVGRSLPGRLENR